MKMEEGALRWRYISRPEKTVLSGSEIRILVGVSADSSAEALDVHVTLWLNGEQRQVLPVRRASAPQEPFFEFVLGSFWVGDVVTYAVDLASEGRKPPKWVAPPDHALSFR